METKELKTFDDFWNELTKKADKMINNLDTKDHYFIISRGRVEKKIRKGKMFNFLFARDSKFVYQELYVSSSYDNNKYIIKVLHLKQNMIVSFDRYSLPIEAIKRPITKREFERQFAQTRNVFQIKKYY